MSAVRSILLYSLLALVIIVYAPGCAYITTVRTAELRVVQNRIDSLRVDIDTLVASQERIESLIRSLKADLQIKYQNVDRKISALAGGISESQEKIVKINEKTAELKKQLELKALQDSIAKSDEPSKVTKLYNSALGDFTAGRYENANLSFAKIRNDYPDSKYVELALYWQAECLFFQDKNKEAAELYKEYIKIFPSGEKLCDALYKLGVVYKRAGKKKSSVIVLKKLITTCPDSDLASEAKEIVKN